MNNFKDLRIVDNFYQTSAFFPMPTTLISTVNAEGKTNIGAYSLCFPYYIAGKDYYAMILEARNSSNTAQNILLNKKATLNFITDERKYFKEAVRLGFPGDTTDEKMKNCIFTLTDSTLGNDRPKIVEESYQVFECTWDDSLEDAFNDKAGCLEGYEPPYRNFNDSVIYAAERIDPNVKFTKEACAKLTKIPRIFLKPALTQMVNIAKEEGITVIDEQALTIINDKRRKEKK